MSTILSTISATHPKRRGICSFLIALMALAGWVAPLASRAGITVNLQADYNNNAGSPYYLLFVNLNTNDLTANPPGTYYYVWSVNGSSNSAVSAQTDWTNGANTYLGAGYGDFDGLMSDVYKRLDPHDSEGCVHQPLSFHLFGFPEQRAA